MQTVSNISSEEELLQLRDEGKISEAEYNDLLAAMRTPPPENVEEAPPAANDAKIKRKLGKIAFVLMLTGIGLPILVFLVCFAITSGGEGDAISSGCFALCVLIEIAALVFGVISWADVYGKATVAVVAALAVLALSQAILWSLIQPQAPF